MINVDWNTLGKKDCVCAVIVKEMLRGKSLQSFSVKRVRLRCVRLGAMINIGLNSFIVSMILNEFFCYNFLIVFLIKLFYIILIVYFFFFFIMYLIINFILKNIFQTKGI